MPVFSIGIIRACNWQSQEPITVGQNTDWLSFRQSLSNDVLAVLSLFQQVDGTLGLAARRRYSFSDVRLHGIFSFVEVRLHGILSRI